MGSCNWVENSIPSFLATLHKRLVGFVKAASRHKRIAATHILVFMISPEDRRSKPYALPVQCIPYKGVSDSKVRELANAVIHEIVNKKMKVAGMYVNYHNTVICFSFYFTSGFVTYGEWNSL